MVNANNNNCDETLLAQLLKRDFAASKLHQKGVGGDDIGGVGMGIQQVNPGSSEFLSLEFQNRHDKLVIPALTPSLQPSSSVDPMLLMELDDSPTGSSRGSSSASDHGAPGTVHSPLSALQSPLIGPLCAKFELPIPPQPTAGSPCADTQPAANLGFICESASRLLFLSVHWVKGIRALADQ